MGKVFFRLVFFVFAFYTLPILWAIFGCLEIFSTALAMESFQDDVFLEQSPGETEKTEETEKTGETEKTESDPKDGTSSKEPWGDGSKEPKVELIALTEDLSPKEAKATFKKMQEVTENYSKSVKAVEDGAELVVESFPPGPSTSVAKVLNENAAPIKDSIVQYLLTQTDPHTPISPSHPLMKVFSPIGQ